MTSRQTWTLGWCRPSCAHSTCCNIAMFRLDPWTSRLQPFTVTVPSQINQIWEMRTEVKMLIYIFSPYLWPPLLKNWGGLQSTHFSMPLYVPTKKNWQRKNSQFFLVIFELTPNHNPVHLFQPMFTPARSEAQSQEFKSFCLNFRIHLGWFC